MTMNHKLVLLHTGTYFRIVASKEWVVRLLEN